MPWYIWFIFADFAFGALWKVAIVGRHRDPVTGLEAAIQVVCVAVYIVLLVNWGMA